MHTKALTNQSIPFFINSFFLILILFTHNIYAANHNVSITLVSGATEEILSNHSVTLYKQLIDGTEQRVRSFTSDNQGTVLMTLTGLEQGQHYFLKSKSIFDGRVKKSKFITSTGPSIFKVGNKLLNVTVTSGIDNNPLANQAVTLYQLLNNGSRKGFRTINTDSNGLLTLDLPGLGSNTNYELRTLPKYGSRSVYSGQITATGKFAFKVGNVRVKAINGQTNSPIANHKIYVYKHNKDGSISWLTYAYTDTSGFADFQLDNLKNQAYLFKAPTLSDGKLWSSNLVNRAGTVNFVIGNKLLKVAVTSGIDNTPLANQEVILFKLLGDGSRKGIKKLTTNSRGLLTLDLPGLGSNTNYELRTLPKYGSRAVYSDQITATGRFDFKVGNIRVKAINGQTNSPIANHKIYVYKHNKDGSISWLTYAYTDTSGFADFQLDNLKNQAYLFKAPTLSDGKLWSSNLVNRAGTVNFVIGNKLLKVAVTSGIDNTPLANQEVILFKLLGDGSRKGIKKLTTNSRGLLTLDLPGLGSDTNYELRTLPKYGSRAVYSDQITATGRFDFKVGNIRVKAINGQTNSPIANHKISVYKVNNDSSLNWFSFANTNSAGLADFQLPNLALGQKYIFKASSLSDGRTWSSPLISSAGSSNFIIGNKLLNVAVTSGIDNSPLANQAVTLYKLLSDGSRKGLRVINTDNNGRLRLDLPGLGNGINYELRTLPKHGSRFVYSGRITSTGRFAFKVGNVRIKAINGQTNNIIANHKISVYKQNTNGSISWLTYATTDASGFADFQLDNLNNQPYLFKAATLSDGKLWSSDLVNKAGTVNFVIGNKLLNVAVTSGIDNTPLVNQAVILYQLLSDGSRKGVRTLNTDSTGHLTLDLPGLGKSTHYELRTLPKHGNRFVYSGVIKNTGNFLFKVANVRIKVINGQTNSPIANHKISIYKHNNSGGDTWFTSSNTDNAGLTDIHLPNLETGQQYIFKAASLSDGRTWSSGIINTEGLSSFIIGNKLLKVSLVNALDNKPIANTDINVFLRMPDNSLKWAQRKTTNSNGQLNFDLKGLDKGSKYVLSSRPYGVKISSKDIIKTGNFKLQAGTVAITLRKKIDNTLIPNQKLSLYEKVAPGKIQWRAVSTTNAKGQVHFDPTELGTGKVYLVVANNLFGNSKNYYSPWILSKGAFDFIVDPSDPHRLDEEAPVFNNVNPSNHAVLADKGFDLKMQITDNNTVKQVNVQVIDPIKGTTSTQATKNKNNWSLLVADNMISRDQTITVKAEAFDQAGNKSTQIYQYSIINDLEKPKLVISSHQEGDQIDEHGFFMSGTVTDNTGYVKLLATIIDPIKGIITDHRELEIGKNHHWALTAKDLSRGEDIIVKLDSVDSAGNISNDQLMLSVMTENSSMIQLINRITYGATPELLKELRDFGTDSFIQRQLHPELIDDSLVEQQLTSLLANENSKYIKLHNTQIARAISSKRQLLAVMTQFWESHFNTDLSKVRNISYEAQEHTLFRQYALGNFRDLLEVSAKSPAMLKYLDNKDSNKIEPNENYARELMELHTLGVDNGYTAKDIAEVARVFTGWGIRGGVFSFIPWRHDNGEKTVLGTIIPADSGVAGGEQVLDLLAGHNSTAKFICTKLLITFVSDTPTATSINHCATDYLAYKNADNQIALVLEGIFKSAEFSASLNFHNKVKTPLEFLVSLYRQLPIESSYSRTRNYLADMRMPLFYFSLPTGWPEKSKDLINSTQLIQRWKISNKAAFNHPSQWRNYIQQPDQFFINKGIETTEGVLGYLFEITLAHDYSELEWNEAQAILNKNQTGKFDIYASDAETKIRNLIALILQYPTYQLQ